jgi:tRNA(Arg) A34 adenosine deaminase TadA
VTSNPGDLSLAEWTCLELAWQALLHGGLPVGAVVLDDAGSIVAVGQNQIYAAVPRESAPGRPQLAGSLLAHAEVNALLGLDPERRYPAYQLVSSLEPCPLCMGALGQSTVGSLSYLAADPYNGGVAGARPTRHTSRVPLAITGPREDAAGRLAAALHVAYYLRRNPGGAVVAAHRELRPDLAGVAGALVDFGVFALAGQQLSWAEVAGPLLALASPAGHAC